MSARARKTFESAVVSMTHLSQSRPASTEQSAALAGLVEQVADHLAAGRHAEIEALIAHHPEHAARVRQLLPAMNLLAVTGQSGASAESANRPAQMSFGTLGDFRIVREIGRGGMGVVYEAEQISLSRRVALKVLPFAGMLDPRQLQRFTNEAKAAAGLHHQNIVPVYAVGNDRGVHFYAMQLISGQTLADVIRTLRAGRPRAEERASQGAESAVAAEIDEALEKASVDRPRKPEQTDLKSEIRNPQPTAGTLPVAELTTLDGRSSRDWFRTVALWGAQIADALDYAHAVGLVHRDVKPANLMLDGDGKVWVTDFGLAQMEADAGLTMTGGIVGTLRYMSPEQAGGQRALVDQRTDVYSLAVTLYELLTLEPAFRAADHKQLLRQVLEEDPKRPRLVAPSLPLDLETIILKATQKEPPQRYATASALADDLRRYLADRPITARRPGLAERARRWCRRHAKWVAAATAMLLLAVVGTSAAAVLILNERNQTAYERKLREEHEQAARLGQRAMDNQRYAMNISLAANTWESPTPSAMRLHLEQCLPEPGKEDLRGFEWRYLATLLRQLPPVFGQHDGQPYTVQFSPDGSLLATGGEDGVRIWRWDTAEPVRWIQDHGATVFTISFTRDGTTMATGGADGTVRIWDTRNWTQVHTLAMGGPAGALFSSDGARLAAATLDFTFGDPVPTKAVIYKTDGWTPEWEISDLTGLNSAAVAPDGNTFVLALRGGRLLQYDFETHELTAQASVDRDAQSVAISPSTGTVVAAVGWALEVWPAGLGGNANPWTPAGAEVARSVSFVSERLLLSAGRLRVAHLWELVGSQSALRAFPVQSFSHDSEVWCIRPAPGGRSMATACTDKTVRRWELNQPFGYRRRLGTRREFGQLVFSPRGDRLFTSGSLTARRDPTTADVQHAFTPAFDAICAAISPDGRLLAVGSSDSRVVVWNTENGAILGDWRPESSGAVRAAEFTPDSARLLVAWDRLGLRTIDLGERVLSKGAPFDRPAGWGLMYGPRGRFLAIHDPGGGIVLGADGKTVLHHFDSGPPSSICSDGTLCVSTFHGNIVQVHRTDDWSQVAKFAIHMGSIRCVAVAPDKRTLAIGTSRGIVELWNLAAQQPLMVLATDFSDVQSLAFSPDGSTLLASGNTEKVGDLRIWRLDPDADGLLPPDSRN
jgi:serine/threonine protein kinase/WD40 repeat protein